MDSQTSAAPTNLIMTADSVAREKGISREDVLNAMELALGKAAKAKYGDYDIRAQVDRKDGKIVLHRFREVVYEDEIENSLQQITLAEAKTIKSDSQIGDFITDELPSFEHGRIAAQAARQTIVQKVREAERERQYEEFKDRVGEIVNGTIKRIEYGNATIDLGTAEGYLRREEIIPREHLRRGDRVRAYLFDVRLETAGPQIFLSRTHPQFMAKLFEQEVPEIYDQLVEIKTIARDPGSRAKISVYTEDPTIDPVGACVGMRGSRVQAVVSELQGEKIDIVPWSIVTENFIVNAIKPAAATKVVLNENTHKIDVVVPEDQLNIAIGRRGQNVRLASMLTGWEVDILTEAEEAEKRQEELATIIDRFTENLDIEDMMARLLVTEGFQDINDLVADGVKEEIAAIDGFDEEIAEQLQARAHEYLEKRHAELLLQKDKLEIQASLSELEGINLEMLVLLGENAVKSLEDFADLSADELLDAEEGLWKSLNLQENTVNDLIMSARIKAGWFSAEELAENQQNGENENENSVASAGDGV